MGAFLRRQAHAGRSLIVAMLLLGMATAVVAHQLRAAVTSVGVNPRTELVEVVHRFYAHDAEHALTEFAGVDGDIRSDPELRDAFARYVGRHFTLADAESTPLGLELVGAEVEGDFLWVYQQMSADHMNDIARIGHDSLQEIWDEQENRVNLRRGGEVTTVILRQGDDLRAVDGR